MRVSAGGVYIDAMLPASEGALTDNTAATFAKLSLRDEDVARAELGVFLDPAVRKYLA